MLKRLLVPPALVLLFVACAPYRVRYDYDSRTDYAGYKTFDWYAASRVGRVKDVKVEDPIMDRRVAAAVEKELTARGFRREAAADPDFLVTYYPIYRERTYRTAQHIGMGRWGGWGYPRFGIGVSTSTSQLHAYQEGTIVLEILDFKTDQLVWKAAAEGALTELRNPEDADEVVTRAVKQMLERFPPKKP